MNNLQQDKTSSLRFVVLQMGARMHYAVPALLMKAGMLGYLYTDIHAGDTLVQGFNFWPEFCRPKPVKRLLGRVIPPEIPRSSIVSVPFRSATESFLKILQAKGIPIPEITFSEELLRQRLLKNKFHNANALYTFTSLDIEIVRKAKNQGLVVVHEQMISTNIGYTISEERQLYPGIEKPSPKLELIGQEIQREQEHWSLSDLILVPSTFVEQVVIQMGSDSQRTVLVPYGINEEWLATQPNPKRGRVLFVGSVGLGKGNHYLAAATRILAKRGVNCEVRVVGPYDPKVIEHPEFKGPTYVGQVPRSEVKQEFLQADIFVLPTLSDSFAIVHLEALACGVPVITTPNCGSVVRDGIEGFIVPIRDAEALADRMEQLLTDDKLRQQMSEQARQRARDFTWEKYQDRLIDALQRLEPKIQ